LAPSRFLIGSGKVYAVRGLHRWSSIQGDRVISTVILRYDVTLRARRMEKVWTMESAQVLEGEVTDCTGILDIHKEIMGECYHNIDYCKY